MDGVSFLLKKTLKMRRSTKNDVIMPVYHPYWNGLYLLGYLLQAFFFKKASLSTSHPASLSLLSRQPLSVIHCALP